MDELPCPECDGWMRLDGRQWACPSCGHRSDELAAEEAEKLDPAQRTPTPADLAVEQGVATSSPSPSRRGRAAGRKRSFGVSLLLGIVTLGIYFLYWQWKVFREVHEQEGTRGWTAFMWASYALVAVRLAWLLSRGPLIDDTPGLPDGGVPGLVLAFAQLGTFLAYLLLETRDLDGVLRERGHAPSAAFGWLAVEAVLNGLATVVPGKGSVVFGVGGLAVALVAYWRLQAGLNLYWDSVRTGPAPAAPTALTPAAS